MTVTLLPFKAVLLACDSGHYEATTAKEFKQVRGLGSFCGLCRQRLRLVKTVTIWPGGRR